MLYIEIKPDSSHKHTYASDILRHALPSIGFADDLQWLVAHPSHPNFNYSVYRTEMMKKGKYVEGQSYVSHVNIKSQNSLLFNVPYRSVITNHYYPLFDSRPAVAHEYSSGLPVNIMSCFVDQVFYDKTQYAERKIGVWKHLYFNAGMAVYWDPTRPLDSPAYKFVYGYWHASYWKTEDALSLKDWTYFLNGKPIHKVKAFYPPTIRLPEPQCTLVQVDGEWVPHRIQGDSHGPVPEAIKALPWNKLSLGRKNRFETESPFHPLEGFTDHKSTFDRTLQQLVDSDIRQLMKRTSAFSQAIYESVRGIQNIELQSLLFIKDTVTAIRDLRKIVKDPNRVVKQLNSKDFGISNTYLATIYGLLPFIDDSKSLIKSYHQFNKHYTKSYGRYMDTNQLYDNVHIEKNTYISSLRYVKSGTVSHSFLNRMRQAGLHVDLNLIWEAIPYSFVADWFGNIGDVVKSFDTISYGHGRKFDRFLEDQLSVKLTVLLLSVKTEGTIDLPNGNHPVTIYHRSPFADMPAIPAVFDLSLHSGYVQHPAEGAALITQRLTR